MTNFNLLSPNIHIKILQNDLHTFPLRISWETLINYLGIFSLVITSLILITLFHDNVWILLGENWCLSLMGLEGLSLFSHGWIMASFFCAFFTTIVFPREIENNAYAIIWRNNKEFLRKAYCMHRIYVYITTHSNRVREYTTTVIIRLTTLGAY